jgi:hypothetical protein
MAGDAQVPIVVFQEVGGRDQQTPEHVLGLEILGRAQVGEGCLLGGTECLADPAVALRGSHQRVLAFGVGQRLAAQEFKDGQAGVAQQAGAVLAPLLLRVGEGLGVSAASGSCESAVDVPFDLAEAGEGAGHGEQEATVGIMHNIDLNCQLLPRR